MHWTFRKFLNQYLKCLFYTSLNIKEFNQNVATDMRWINPTLIVLPSTFESHFLYDFFYFIFCCVYLFGLVFCFMWMMWFCWRVCTGSECEAAVMKVLAFKSEAGVFNWRKVEVSFLFFFVSDREVEVWGSLVDEWWNERYSLYAIMRLLLQSSMVKELSQTANLSIYWFIYTSIFTFAYEVWILTKTINDKKGSSSSNFVSLGGLGFWLGCLLGTSLWRFSGQIPQGGVSERLTGGILYTFWFGSTFG